MVTIYYNTLKSVTTPIDKGISRISFLGKIAKCLPRPACKQIFINVNNLQPPCGIY